MSVRKEPSSLGRIQGRSLARDNSISHDSLSSHPLLSPPPSTTSPLDSLSSNATPSPNTASSANTTSVPPKYVPYTPRHRVTTSSVTIAPQAPPSLSTTGPATPQLQIQNLKAAAQNAQLSLGSIGWAICEKLYAEGEGAEWEELWNAIANNKATLLLPMDALLPQESITPDYIRDHMVYLGPPTSAGTPLVTLSGLRGTLSSSNLTFRSTLSPTSPHFIHLHSLPSRSSTFSLLPPIPAPLIVPLTPEYPVFNIPLPPTTLPFPSSPQHKPLSRPVLSTPRLNPFATLFGAKPSPSMPTISLPKDEGEERAGSVDVQVYIIQGRIIKKDVLKDISTALKAELKEALTGLPSWLVDKALAFTSPLHPTLPTQEKKSTRQTPSSTKGGAKEGILPDMSDQEKASESFQDFYAALEEELRDREEGEKNGEVTDGEEAALLSEKKRAGAMERVERAVCALFYDQLFRQPNSDDASHDEALSSRIAALNMLDLGLEHLGIDIGDADPKDLQEIVATVGQLLQRLSTPSIRAPLDKSALLVQAHTAAVEGLSELPPIRLKPEDEQEMNIEDPTPVAEKFKQKISPGSKEGLEGPVNPLSPSEQSLVTDLPSPSEDSEVKQIPEGAQADEIAKSAALTSNSRHAGKADIESSDMPKSPQYTTSPIHDSINATQPIPPKQRTPVSSDILLPFLIYVVVKSNPPSLISHLLYIQRYRSHYAPNPSSGEEQFSLINLLAVCEFIENVDLAALGLGDTARVLSVKELAPLPIPPISPGEGGFVGGLKGRGAVLQAQVEELAGNANRVFSGVVDSSFSALKGLLSSAPHEGQSPNPIRRAGQPTTPQSAGFQRFGLLRRGTEITLASVASGLPALTRVATGGSRRGEKEEEGRMLVEVPSRPESVSMGYNSEEMTEESEEEDEEDDHNENEGQQGEARRVKNEVRSVRSFGSMMSGESRERRWFSATGGGGKERMPLSDRLANVSVRSRLGKDTSSTHAQSPPSGRLSLLGVAASAPATVSRPSSPLLKIPPPNERFMDCSPDDLRISEVSELLVEYRRVVEGLRALGGFED